MLLLGLVVCALCVLVAPSVQADTIFGAESSGQYWGANIYPDGRAATVKFPVYPGFSKTTGAVAVDSVTGQMLFEHYQPHSLTYGPMCANSPGVVPKFLFNITDVVLEDASLGEAFSGKARAFAIHDSKIYFLYYGSYFGDAMTHKFQVRVLQSCADCGVDPYEENTTPGSLPLLYTVKCSEVVVENTFEDEEGEDVIEYNLGNVLKVVRNGNSEKLDFYFQVGKLDLGSQRKTEVLLYHADSNGAWEQIHTQTVNNRYSGWDLHLIGAVDYMDGLLCWTTIDRMMCKYDDQVHTVVNPSEALTSSICQGGTKEVASHLTDISGVAILKGNGDRMVLFGCSPQTADIRGSGILHISRDGATRIEALTASEEKLSAASISTVKTLHGDCTFEPEPVHCVRRERPTTTLNPPTTSTTTTEQPQKPNHEDENGEKSEPEGKPSDEPTEDNTIEDGSKGAVSGGDDNNAATATFHIMYLMTVLAVSSVSCWMLS